MEQMHHGKSKGGVFTAFSGIQGGREYKFIVAVISSAN